MNEFSKIFIAITLFLASDISAVHLLHLSFHQGCINEVELIAQQLGFDITSLFINNLAPQEFDGITSGNVLYNIGHERAENIWNKHKDYFNQFDGIITSDTAPLSRIFLQNKYEKPIIIWVCNRFDYADTASLDCVFPDEHYYQLLQEASTKNSVYIVPYNSFESFYAAQKNVIFNSEVIKPTGMATVPLSSSSIPTEIDKAHTFFIPPYLNETSSGLIPQCQALGISVYRGRYNGPADLAQFKGIIHIPYAWSNFAFFENIQNGLPYFVPSIRFFLQMYDAGQCWWPNGNFLHNHHALAEWYNEENSSIITYFDSWQDLKDKIDATDFEQLKCNIQHFAHKHTSTVLKQWKSIIDAIR